MENGKHWFCFIDWVLRSESFDLVEWFNHEIKTTHLSCYFEINSGLKLIFLNFWRVFGSLILRIILFWWVFSMRSTWFFIFIQDLVRFIWELSIFESINVLLFGTVFSSMTLSFSILVITTFTSLSDEIDFSEFKLRDSLSFVELSECD